MRHYTLSLYIFLYISASFSETSPWYLPIQTINRQTTEQVILTGIGEFGLMRKARPRIPAHLHTGSDFTRPSDNYTNEPVFPAAEGRVLSMRDDGPFAQIIIAHVIDSTQLWTVYEHVAGIRVIPGDRVTPDIPIARFMTRAELNTYGWQFDHLHFEVMKATPWKRTPDTARPHLHAGTFALTCHTRASLNKCYYDPLRFFTTQWQQIAAGNTVTCSPANY